MLSHAKLVTGTEIENKRSLERLSGDVGIAKMSCKSANVVVSI